MPLGQWQSRMAKSGSIGSLPIGHQVVDRWVEGLREQEDQRERKVCCLMGDGWCVCLEL